jgi:hypothetical protein
VGGEFVDCLGARRHRVDRARVVEGDAAQHLSAVHPRRCRGGGRRRGHAVVEFEHRPGQPAAVERREHHLVLQRPEQYEVVEDVRGRQHAVHPGIGERGAQPVEQVDAVVHGGRPRADRERAAGGVVGGDDHQPAVTANGRPGAAGLPGLGDGPGVGGAHLGDPGVVRAYGAGDGIHRHVRH